MNRSTHTSRAAVNLRAPAVLDDDAATSFVDLQGFDAVEILVTHGAVTAAAGANRLEFSLEAAPSDADPEDEGDYVAVPATDILGTFAPLQNAVAAGVQRVAYVGKGRYVRVIADETGIAAAVVGIVAILDQASRERADATVPATGTAS